MRKIEHKSISSQSQKLFRHNQFVLGPFFVKSLESWDKIRVNDSLYLTAHPDLNTCQAASGDKSLTLLGFILDPDNPGAGDKDILAQLINMLERCDNFFGCTYGFGGRWILIVNDGKETMLFNDAVGLRQVFYTDIHQVGEFWCASQPGMIAEIRNLKMDECAVDYINSYEFRRNPEFRWPGESTPYKEIKHLLPNHYLNLGTGRCRRYWPDKPLGTLSFEEAMGKASKILKGAMEAVSNRFDLTISVTAGLDSRVVLAASKAISRKVSYVTVRQIGMPDDHPDVTIPSRLLSELGLEHNVVRSSLILDDEFIDIFKSNVPLAHYIYAPDAQAIFRYYGQSKVVVTGSTSEVSRSSFRALLKKPENGKVTLHDFAMLQGMGNNQFAFDHYNKWLSGLNEIYDVDVLNLFEWELDDGNWLAMCQVEFDIGWKDIFTPFNCRDLITAILPIEKKYMMPPGYEFYMKLIEDLWPEVLHFPINPQKSKKKQRLFPLLKSYIRNRLFQE